MLLRRYRNVKPKEKPLIEHTVAELRAICKERGLKGYSKLNEDELIKLLEGGK